MRADREIQMQMLAALHAFQEHALEVRHLRQVRQHGGARAQHQPAAADIAPPGLRIDRIVDGRRQIRRAVVLVLHVERQPGQVDGVAGEHDLLHRRLGLRNLDHRLRVRHPPPEFLRKIALVARAERGGVTAAAAADRADDLEMLGPGILEQCRLGRGLDHGADVGERDRLVVDIDLAHADQLLDKAPQPELFEIDARHRVPPCLAIAAMSPAAIRINTRPAIRGTNTFPIAMFSLSIGDQRSVVGGDE